MSLQIIGFLLLVIQLIGRSDALFEGCDRVYNLKSDSVAYLQSPYYNQKYPSGTSCRYKFIVPLDYELLAECSIALDKGPTACTTEYFYIAQDGDLNLSGAQQFCGVGNITRTSLFREMVIAYISSSDSGSGVGGKFLCKLTTRPQACDCGWSTNTRIVGGVSTTQGEFPSMVALFDIPSNKIFCGGSIISHYAVLTATHCTNLYANPENILILAGDYDLSLSTESKYQRNYTVMKYIEKPGYDSVTNANDITLLITNSPIEWSRGVGPICLPFDQLTNTFDYTDVDVVGWGATSFAGPTANILQKAAMNIIPNPSCMTIYPALLSSQVCTYYPGRDSCQYDSGGPVVYKSTIREFLLGLISFGEFCATQPGVNTRITSFIDWIQSNQDDVGPLCSKPFS